MQACIDEPDCEYVDGLFSAHTEEASPGCCDERFELDACSWLLMHGEAQVWQQIAFFQTQLCGRSFLPAVE